MRFENSDSDAAHAKKALRNAHDGFWLDIMLLVWDPLELVATFGGLNLRPPNVATSSRRSHAGERARNYG